MSDEARTDEKIPAELAEELQRNSDMHNSIKRLTRVIMEQLEDMLRMHQRDERRLWDKIYVEMELNTDKIYSASRDPKSDKWYIQKRDE